MSHDGFRKGFRLREFGSEVLCVLLQLVLLGKTRFVSDLVFLPANFSLAVGVSREKHGNLVIEPKQDSCRPQE